MRRSLSILVAAGLLLVGSLAFAGGASAATPGPTTTCGNGTANGGGQGVICQVTIVNTITATGGSSRVTIRWCHGSAGVPTTTCVNTTTNLTTLVTNVTQCNGSVNGGGSTLRCSVAVTNRFIGMSTGATAATVNQCVGSGDGIANNCDPFPASTTNATITQCNGSANGGTLVRLECTATGTKPASHGVRINQCNDSANEGGSLVICSASIRNLRIAVAAPSSGSSGGSNAGPTPPSTDTLAVPDAAPSGVFGIVIATIFSLTFIAAMAGVAGRRTRRAVRTR